ncbi:GNAT family N-acetyltransferase [Rhodococcus sp. IEGM 1381]|uniref:GNAT family N-acetyltransferase n=1 Tax=Rhodococcus sp. IEGM 1381 TaxID=3047085 RepID=UPI0024B8213A|nr:GNAT family N-acetyltransferase [Rhodococcus sp. IEGM 1381]MDI9895669.1 GNAT family N-acetyltransferase [Rhodococcus sp. IEGM 1381]
MALVRPRNAVYLPRCVEALSEVHESDDYPHRWPPDPAGWLTPENMAAAWVAEHENCIVGHVVIVDKSGVLWVSRLFVRPGYRGSLVGDSLLRQARIGGASMLDVIERSSKAIELYERTGWTLVDTRPADWIMTDGRRPVERIYRVDPHSNQLTEAVPKRR